MNKTLIAVCFAIAGFAAPLTSQALPSVKIGTASLISPTAANSYYGSSTISTTGIPGRPMELVELARALNNNVDEIYDFVRNNIDITFMYGLQKGPLGTLFDRSGTAFDQAELMVELLRQAGYTAGYQAGTISLNQAQFAAWTNISDAQAACKLLSSGGIPAIINGSTTANCGYAQGTAVSSVQMAHIWVAVTIGSTVYLFDPAYKGYNFKTGIDLYGATGMTQTAPLSAATGGMSTGTAGTSVSYVQSLNGLTLKSDLNTWSNNLLNYINNHNLSTAEIDDIVGGRQIAQVAAPAGGLRQLSLPYPTCASPAPACVTWTGGIPDQYRTTLEVQITKELASDGSTPTIIDKTLFVDEIYGRKLIFGAEFRPGFNGQLLLVNDAMQGPVLASYGNGDNPTYSYGTVTLKANHPYAAAADGSSNTTGDYMDATVVKAVTYATPMLILHGWGDAGPGLVEAYGQGIDTALHQVSGSILGCENCVAAGFSSAGNAHREHMAASWLAQTARSARIHAWMSQSVYSLHHALGVASADTSTNLVPIGQDGTQIQYAYAVVDSYDRIDVESAFSLSSMTTSASSASSRRAAILAIAATSEAMESNVIAQGADLPDTSSISTRFEWGNAPPSSEDPSGSMSGVPRRFFQVDSSNASQVGNLVLTEGAHTNTNNGPETATQCNMTEDQSLSSQGNLLAAVNAYTAAGFKVVTSEEAFLGPGQRCGAILRNAINPGNGIRGGDLYYRWLAQQRGGALLAVRYDSTTGDPLEIASIVLGTSGDFEKGGGGGTQTIHQAQYDPSQSASLIKSRFVDRSKLLGVDLKKGSLTHTSPAALSVGNGGFPYELSAQLIWRGGPPITTLFGPISHVQPQVPWTTNWNSMLGESGNGMEALGVSDVRAAVSSITAFLAQQAVFNNPQSPQRDVTAMLVGAWWGHEVEGNVVTASVGNSTRQFLLAGQDPQSGNNIWITAGGDPYATLTQTGTRSKFTLKPCDKYYPDGPDVPDSYILTRGWDYSTMSFTVTNGGGDKQNFSYWLEEFHPHHGDFGTCAKQRGFRMSSWTFPKGMSITLSYAQPDPGYSLSELVSVSNSLNRQINFTASGLGGFNNNLSGADGRSVTVTNNSDGSDTHTDPVGDPTRFTYTTLPWGTSGYFTIEHYLGLNQVFTADNPSQPSLEYDYDTLRRISQAKDAVSLQQGTRAPYQFLIGDAVRGQRQDPSGNAYTVLYDLRGNPSQYIDELGRVTQASRYTTGLQYDLRGRVHQYIYPENDQELLGYDDHNNLTSFVRLDKAGANPLSISATYQQNCNKIASLTDARINVTNWAYDPVKCVLNTVTQPKVIDGKTGNLVNPITQYTYNSRGQMATETDPVNTVTKMQYDEVTTSPSYGSLLNTIVDYGDSTHLNLTTSMSYDNIGDVASVTDGNGKITTNGHDADRRLTSISGPTTTAHPTCIKSESIYTGGLLTKTRRASKCSPVETTDADWQFVTTTAYTPTKKPQLVTDGSGYQTITAYDANDRISDVTQCLSSSSSPSLSCPGAQRVTHTTYDGAGEVLKLYKGWGSGDQINYSTSFYTPDGNLDHVLDANGHSTAFNYDGYNRLIKTLYADTTFEQYGYDASGNPMSLCKRDGVCITWNAYDALNRPDTRHTPPNLNGHFDRSVQTTYDLDSRKYNVTAEGQTLQFRYDNAGRQSLVGDTLLNALGANVGNLSYGYDGDSNRTSAAVITTGSGWSASYTYDDGERLQQVSAGIPCATYTLNPLSQVTHELLLDGSTVDRTFQPNGDLWTLSHGFNGGTSLGYTYTVNGAHQITQQQVTSNAVEMQAGSASTYTANAVNQYTSAGGVTPTYDVNGNLTYDGAYHYEYDEDNRLRTATGAHAVSYAYDPVGRRRSKAVDGTTTYFIWDGDNEIAETNTAGVRQHLYLNADGSDLHIGMYTASGGTWDLYHLNHQGSTAAMSRQGGTGILGTYSYGAYGEPGAGNPVGGSVFGYAGRYLDAETGLYYYRARYYSPTLGRFLQTDPIGNKDDLDLYAYVKDDPVNAADPQGTECVTQNTSSCGESSAANSAAEGATAWAGQNLIRTGETRAAYSEKAQSLENTDTGGRTEGKGTAREATPQPAKSIVQAMRPEKGSRTGSTTSANKTNPAWNKAGKIAGIAGKASLAATVVLGAHEIATSSNPARATAGVGGSILGGVGGGEGGAIGGALVGGALAGPPGAAVGAILGAVGGSTGGGYAGHEAGTAAYDAVNEGP